MDVKNGILPDTAIEELVQSGAIAPADRLDDKQVQPASLDLRLGDRAYRVRASFLPGPDNTVQSRLDEVSLHVIGLTAGAVLETGCVYIVPLLERLNLPPGLAAATNPKSSTGRLDIFTRVITDYGQSFDQVPEGYSGPLYLEISPRTFPIVVQRGSRLSQIRFRQGATRLDDAALEALHTRETLASDSPRLIDGLALSIDLAGQTGQPIGYRARRHTGLIDVDRPGAYRAADYWQPLLPGDLLPSGGLILDPDQFYILVSREAVHVPPDYAAEMVPFDPLVGEFRVHYAGFFDPGFGHDKAGGHGSRAVLEVRSHEVPFILEHAQTIGRLIYESMSDRPRQLYGLDLGSNYQAQGLKLSKHFILDD